MSSVDIGKLEALTDMHCHVPLCRGIAKRHQQLTACLRDDREGFTRPNDDVIAAGAGGRCHLIPATRRSDDDRAESLELMRSRCAIVTPAQPQCVPKLQ